MTDQLAGFQTRIKKIKDPKNTYYVDPETGTFIPKRLSKKQIKTATKRPAAPPTFMGLIFALMLGACGLVGATYLRFHYLELPDASPSADTLSLIDFGIAAIAIFFLGGMLGQKSFKHMVAQTAGIGLMMVSMHNLVWAFPDEFSQAFSSAYVQDIQSVTEPHSIYLRGELIPIPL